MSIKLLILCVFVITASIRANKPTVRLPEADNALIIKAVKSCFANTNIPLKSVFTILRESKNSEDQVFTEAVHCTYDKLGYINANGNLIPEKVTHLFPNNADVVDVIIKCSKENGQGPVDTTFKNFKCFQTYSPVGIEFA